MSGFVASSALPLPFHYYECLWHHSFYGDDTKEMSAHHVPLRKRVKEGRGRGKRRGVGAGGENGRSAEVG